MGDSLEGRHNVDLGTLSLLVWQRRNATRALQRRRYAQLVVWEVRRLRAAGAPESQLQAVLSRLEAVKVGELPRASNGSTAWRIIRS